MTTYAEIRFLRRNGVDPFRLSLGEREKIRRLAAAARTGDAAELLRAVRRLVPEVRPWPTLTPVQCYHHRKKK